MERPADGAVPTDLADLKEEHRWSGSLLVPEVGDQMRGYPNATPEPTRRRVEWRI